MTQVISVREETGRRRVQTTDFGPSKTVQGDAVRADIRHIMKKYRAMGIMDHLAQVDLTFRDVSEFTDFADLMRQTKDAEMAFMKLPSKLREVFDHDVMKWLDAAHDPEKVEALRPKLEKLGVMKPKEAPAVVQAAAPVSAPAAVPPAGTPAA